MRRRVLVDTGPLVALLSAADRHHTVCVEQLKALTPPLLTGWPVLTEAAWLLRRQPEAVQRLLRSADKGLLQILTLEEHSAGWIAEFMQRYQDAGAQLADASLVYLAEREGINTIFTLDRRDFSIYRLTGGRRFVMLPEPSG